MVMRISSIQAFNNGVSGIGRNYSDVIRTQEQISSGKRILTPADDPVASVRLLQLEQQQAMLTQHKDNLTAATNSLTQEETTLNSVNTVLQRIRELAVQAGGGTLSAEDRKSIAKELSEREGELLNLMNSRNARGEYLFAGNLGKTEPFVRNPDGTYSYRGDEGQRSLQVASSTTVAINDNGKVLFENVTNANRVLNINGVDNAALAGQVPPLPSTTIPAVASDEQRVFMSPGLVQDNDTFNSTFRDGEPYSLVFVSGSEFRIYDGTGADVTSEVPGSGQIDPLTSNGNVINFRGMRFQLDVVLQEGDNEQDLDNLLADIQPPATAGSPGIGTHSFTLQAAPTEFAATRSSTNTSTAVVGGGTITNQATFNSQFPTSGVVLRFTNATDYDVYAQPVGASSTPIASGTAAGPYPSTFNVFGADFSLSAAASTGDEFSVQPQFQEQRSILNTISRLRQALESAPTSPAGNLSIRDEVAIALTNMDNGIGQVLGVQTEIGARLNLIDTTTTDNEDVTLVNKSVQADLRELDYAEALSRLSFQTVILEAAQQSYVKIAGLSLFDKLG
ncbi:MAG: flagellar hook-associated protein 3 [Pseudomonas sp.]